MHIYTHDLCQQHEVPAGHPERPERLTALLAHLDACGITQDAPLRAASIASIEDIRRAHPQHHVDFVQSMAPTDNSGPVPLDPDTWAGRHSVNAARHAAGAVCDGITDLLTGNTNRVFCAVRPPGHHAEIDAAMGFCLFNSIAIGALRALDDDRIQRVAILDFDVHHGNGTVDIFKDNPDVLVCSSFQHPHYPNRMFDIQRNNIINTPLPAGADGEVFRKLVEDNWLSALERHQPDLIMISAGFDAHQRDPLANINLVEDDFAWVTALIVDAAERFCGGRILSTLEGGYDLDALCSSVEAHLRELA